MCIYIGPTCSCRVHEHNQASWFIGTSEESNFDQTYTYLKLVRHVLTQMYRRKMVVTNTELSKYTIQKSDKMSSNYEEVIFLTRQQQAILGYKPRRVIFKSDFGTGKTILLKAQARELGKPKHRGQRDPGVQKDVIFVVFLGEKSLLANYFRQMAELFWNIETLCLESGKKSFIKKTD